jgi:hypothetical protein
VERIRLHRVLDGRPLSIVFFFKSGLFAWNGLFGFYLPFVTFWIWFFVMTYTIRRSLHRLDDGARLGSPAAVPLARRERQR